MLVLTDVSKLRHTLASYSNPIEVAERDVSSCWQMLARCGKKQTVVYIFSGGLAGVLDNPTFDLIFLFTSVAVYL